MPTRAIASLSVSFGLVSIPVKLYSATESSAAIRFKLIGSNGGRIKQQYVLDASPPPSAQRAEIEEPTPEPKGETRASSRVDLSKVVEFRGSRHAVAAPPYEPTPPTERVVERSEMLKGYEYAKGKFVLFNADELKALQAASRTSIDIISFIPEKVVDPIYYDRAYLLAPDRHGAKPYNLLLRAMRDTGRCALARWAFRSKEYVVQIRAANGGMVLQQLLYADEVRSFADLHIETTKIGDAELSLAKQLIAQISSGTYDPTEFVDEEKKRILEAVDKKIAGKQVSAPEPAAASGGQVIDLLEALRASLQRTQDDSGTARTSKSSLGQRKSAKRAPRKSSELSTASAKARSGKR